jgi:hypothetical protein
MTLTVGASDCPRGADPGGTCASADGRTDENDDLSAGQLWVLTSLHHGSFPSWHRLILCAGGWNPTFNH